MSAIETLEKGVIYVRKRSNLCSKLTTKTPERHQWRYSTVFIINFEHISSLFLVFLLLTLNKHLLAGKVRNNHMQLSVLLLTDKVPSKVF